jgi:HEAT repeat protein
MHDHLDTDEGPHSDKSTEQLLAELQHHSVWWMRRDAAEYLGYRGDRQATPYLIRALRDPEPQVCLEVVLALGRLRALQAVDHLLRLFPNVSYTNAVAYALANIGDQRVVEPLIAALQADLPVMRLSAAEALGKLGDIRAFEPLVATLQDADLYVRHYAVDALGALADRRAVEPLLATLSDPEPLVRRCAIEALERLGDRRAVAPLIHVVISEEGDIRCFTIIALGTLGDTRAVEPLLDIVNGNDNRHGVRYFAAIALGKLGDNRAFEPLLAALQDQVVEMRIAAAEGLGYLGNDRALPALAGVAQHDDGFDEYEGAVREAATRAINRISSRCQS